MSGFYLPLNEVAQERANIWASMKARADNEYDRVLSVTGNKDQADAAWLEIMDEAARLADEF